MQMVIDTTGTLTCLYEETIDLGALGRPHIRRASHIEPDQHGRWLADLSPFKGPVLGPFFLRSEAIQAERDWLEMHRLARPL